MRKLKFRVWSGNMWLDGNDANIHAVNSDETDIELVSSYPHKKLIMCQWTGLLDRHGKEIWEGDIVKIYHSRGEWEGGGIDYKEWDTYKVKFERGGFVILTGDFLGFQEQERIEVIGNIYENPELLNP
jgi:uncharacterized phage protein (TIGR01671 family)